MSRYLTAIASARGLRAPTATAAEPPVEWGALGQTLSRAAPVSKRKLLLHITGMLPMFRPADDSLRHAALNGGSADEDCIGGAESRECSTLPGPPSSLPGRLLPSGHRRDRGGDLFSVARAIARRATHRALRDIARSSRCIPARYGRGIAPFTCRSSKRGRSSEVAGFIVTTIRPCVIITATGCRPGFGAQLPLCHVS